MLYFRQVPSRPDRLSMMLDSESLSAPSQHPPRATSFNQPVHARPLALFPPSFNDLTTVPPEIWQPDDRTIVRMTETQTSGITSPPYKQVKRVAHYPSIQDDLRIIADVEPFQTLRFQTPVKRLPPEILAYVFELCLDIQGKSTHVFVPAGPFCFVQVCRFWRAIAESDPHLWTSIHFYFPDGHQSREKDVQRVKHVLDLHLQRSGVLPISLTFTDHRFYHATTEDLISLLVDHLRSYSRRWKCISLHLSCGYFPLLLTFMPCDLSSLEHLSISGDVLGQRIVTALPVNLKSAKNLRSFAYSGPGHSLDDKIDLHWERLAEVSFEFTPHNGMSSTLSRQFKRLAQCQSITTCSLGVDRPFWLDLAGDQTITLPCLRTLRVRRLSPRSHARTVIDALILPQLQTLEIDAVTLVGCNPTWHGRNFSNLLARSGCTLHRLSIQDVDFPNDELLRCLALSHTLTSFRFIPCPRSQDISDVIRKLTASRPVVPGPNISGPLAPKLREITLASSVEGCLELMMAMFWSRVGAHTLVAGVAALQRIEVVFFDMSHGIDVTRVGRVPSTGDRLGRVVSFQRELARWGSENEDEWGEGGLKASVIIDSPYHPEYIDVV